MAKKDFFEQLQAYSLGCLDKEDLTSLRSYIHSGQDYPWQELGEYQNLAALLPSILNIEIPGPQLKDKVARKLYRIRDEIRAKRTNELNSLRTSSLNIPAADEEESAQSFYRAGDSPDIESEDLPVEEETADPGKNVETEISGDSVKPGLDYHGDNGNPTESKPGDFEVVTPIRKTSDFFRPPQEIQAKEPVQKNISEPSAPSGVPSDYDDKANITKDEPAVHSHLKHEEPEEKEKPVIMNYREAPVPPKNQRNTLLVVLISLLFLLLVIAGIYAYFSISSDVKSYKTEVSKLNEDLKNLSGKSDVTKELQKMLESPNTRIITLSSVNNSGYGKLIFNPDESRGYLQLGGMPVPPSGSVYQLWINAKGNNFFSLGLFTNAGPVEYYPFNLPELSNPFNIKILLTQEPAGGSARPEGKVYLTGTL